MNKPEAQTPTVNAGRHHAERRSPVRTAAVFGAVLVTLLAGCASQPPAGPGAAEKQLLDSVQQD